MSRRKRRAEEGGWGEDDLAPVDHSRRTMGTRGDRLAMHDPGPSRATSYGYQDEEFDVVEVRGRALDALTMLLDDEGLPLQLLGRLEDGQRFQVYLDAFIGFWLELDDEGHLDVLRDHEGCTAIDLARTHGLTAQAILRASCHRDHEGTRIEIAFASGTIRLGETDPSDPHCASRIEFIVEPAT